MPFESAKKAIIYCRVSRRIQDDEGSSMDSQERECRAFAAAKGYESCDITREIFTGVELWDRPLLTQIRIDIKSKKYSALICYSTDRLSRDPIHLAIVAEECDRAGCDLLFVSEPLDMSPEGALIRYVRGYAAKIEHAKIRERSMRGKLQKFLDGQYLQGGPNLYGYRHIKETGLREVIESEALIIRQIFRWGSEGISIRGISARLRTMGVPSPSAGKINYSSGTKLHIWHSTTVRRLLKNPAYKGETWAHRYAVVRTNSRELRRLDPSEWIRLPDNVSPAIVSPEIWERANEVLKLNKGDTRRNLKYPMLLRGMVYCDNCGLKSYIDKKPTSRGAITYYRCSSRTYTKPCGSRCTPSIQVEEWVWNIIAEILQNPSVIKKGVGAYGKAGNEKQLRSDLQIARRRAGSLEREEQNLIRRYRSVDDDVAKLIEEELGRIVVEKRNAAATIEEIERQLQRGSRDALELKGIQELGARIKGQLDTFSFEEKVQTLKALKVKIYANGPKYRLDVPLIGGELTSGRSLQSHFTTYVSFYNDEKAA